jgi:hypothetical protein
MLVGTLWTFALEGIMSKKVAVAFVHGIGTQDKYYADGFMDNVLKACKPKVNSNDIAFKAIHWAEALQVREDALHERLRQSRQQMGWPDVRQLMVNFVADALAYQVIKDDRSVYDDVHKLYAIALRRLAQEAGGDTPLIIVAHSLGTVITSNYIYDLQYDGTFRPPKGRKKPEKRELIADEVRKEFSGTPLEQGQTLARLYTLGSPLALWSLRYTNLGKPLRLASPPVAYQTRYPEMTSQWINIYDKDDVIGYPLKSLNADYDDAVYQDLQIEVGGPVQGRTPMAHVHYDTSSKVVNLIADGIIQVWQTVNR